jgi:small-conductance mechanosensitive channel
MLTNPTMSSISTNQSEKLPMSFREKSAWACAATIIAVFVPYFVHVYRLFERQELTAMSILPAFIAAVVVQVALLVAAHIVFAIRAKQEQKDERDRAIEAKSFHSAYFVCAFFAFFGVGWVIMYTIAAGSATAARVLTPITISQMVLFCFVMAEVTKYLTQAVSYRRGR